MNVTMLLSTPEDPVPHPVTYRHVDTVRYTKDSTVLDMVPGVNLGLANGVVRFDLAVVLDVLVTP